MKKLYEDNSYNKIVIISSDGDYKKLVDHLIYKNKLESILFPTNKPSALYKKLPVKYFSNLSVENIKRKIGLKMKKDP